jgi:hypothetical protein
MPLHRARYAAHSDYCNRHSQKMHQTPLERIDRLPARAEDLAAAFTQDGLPGLRVVLKDLARRVRATMAANMQVRSSSQEEAAA